jgi:hypothetical protein
MKILFLGLILILTCLSTSTSQLVRAQNPEHQIPTRYALRTLGPYNSSRIGYESLPVRVVGGGGGKLGPNEKFKFRVSLIRNDTVKNVAAVKITSFIFKFDNQDELVETRQTALIPLELLAGRSRTVDLLVGYVDDIPLLCNNPSQEFSLEMAITEVHYDDGSIWQATDLPQKRQPTKTP